MNRYGDTPLGMVESALEFLRIAESHGFRQLVLSMKSSNPKVMIQAYRLLVERMDAEDMHYPLHLGVTEAGDGEDGRIKSAIGIGSLLLDGLGDTKSQSRRRSPRVRIRAGPSRPAGTSSVPIGSIRISSAAASQHRSHSPLP
jgi:4-hydroxy-3-methylbut-2-en-1-yl diphosphate synthase IspG/GcpE